ncbi:MAG TPA: ATP-binding protein [Blastocatellia bacterium]
MGARIRAFDWSKTQVGVIEDWPQSLRTAVRIILNSRYPMFVWWGPQYINFYNDAYIPMLGHRHPEALGRPAPEIWSEIWDVVGPQADLVLSKGEATWNEELLLVMQRYGYPEETYFTFSYSPIADDEGGPCGVFSAVIEDTQRVLSERRMRTLRELAAATAEARSAEEACELSARALARNPHDLPFSLLYLLDADGRTGRLAGTAGISAGTPASPKEIEVAGSTGANGGWPVEDALTQGRSTLIEDLPESFGRLPGGPWPEPSSRAMVLPVANPGQERPAGFMVAGISPLRPLDDDYRGFLSLVARHMATAVSSARAYEEERKRAEALAELDHAKTAFFSNISHEFRTPLTLMLGPVEDLLADQNNSLTSAERERLEMSHRNALRLLKLVNTLLDFSRIEAGRSQAVYEPEDLSRLTTELASVFRSAIERAGLRLVVDCPPLPEPIYVDKEMWEKIVLNLISNAFKFTFEGEIEVSLIWRGDRAELKVRDTGTGIPSHELPEIFKRFHRIRGARSRTQEGSGIGLALVEELARLHGGEISVESDVGKGTLFTVTVPAGSAHLPPDRVGAARTMVSTAVGASPYVEEALRWLPHGDEGVKGWKGERVNENLAAVTSSPLHPFTPSHSRILLADDNADMREYVRRLLKHRWEVEAVPNGMAALAAARERLPDLVIADVMMPEMDGFELLREIRADERMREVPVILLSARAGEESRVEGLEAGASDYLAKPFSARELMARVHTHLEMARMRRESARREQQLRHSERLYRAIGESINYGIWVCEASGKNIYASESFLKLVGLTQEECSEFGWGRVLHPDDIETTMAAWTECVREGTFWEREHRFLGVDGKWHYILARGVPISDDDGNILCWAGINLDISALKQTEQALQEADRRKDEFLAMLAHELRNPLAPIRNAAQVMRKMDTPDPQLHWARDVIDRQVEDLTHLVDDLLDVSRITQGKVTLKKERVDLESVVARAVETSRPLIDARKHEFAITLPPEPVQLEGDLTRLGQVVSNLLNNAAKYTEEGGKIWLAAERAGDELVLRVRDTGIGIPAETLPHVFDLFSQADRSLDRSQGGLGIGLTLVRSLVEMHGGKVEASSDGPGHGSQFVVRLPALPEYAQEARFAPSSDGAPVKSATCRILVVDDNVDSAESLVLLLRLYGHEVLMAHDGPETIEAARSFNPQIVLLDIGLPGMSGYEVAAALRAEHGATRLLLVALTGYGREEDRRRALESGFDYHIVKPIDPDILQSLISSYI